MSILVFVRLMSCVYDLLEFLVRHLDRWVLRERPLLAVFLTSLLGHFPQNVIPFAFCCWNKELIYQRREVFLKILVLLCLIVFVIENLFNSRCAFHSPKRHVNLMQVPSQVLESSRITKATQPLYRSGTRSLKPASPDFGYKGLFCIKPSFFASFRTRSRPVSVFEKNR
ncbi:hypothetical protein JTE90_005965 [Oedothorax gibbosus]|uniref:Uncharacterized protein n=1 Tax=Oedothorax gibbosus TaxID=931172 RepID=A0AAV6UVU4_9ARAC|nr:hypothetical protein JTE90_005965 [Oedothorax gibbosus]